MSFANRHVHGSSANPLGLACAADGVFLAGTPLLRITAEGLAPRSCDEVAILMRIAYDAETDVTRLLSGLRVAAKALNDQDVGRAMIACVHLRLQPLTPHGAALLEMANDALAKANFNPDEPRDARGRWTSGGESTATGSVRPESSASGALGTAESRMKPILISDGPANDNAPGTDLSSIPFELYSLMITRNCINDAMGRGDLYDKTQDCTAARQKCDLLISISRQNPRFQGLCTWPNGHKVLIKWGMFLTITEGHPW